MNFLVKSCDILRIQLFCEKSNINIVGKLSFYITVVLDTIKLKNVAFCQIK